MTNEVSAATSRRTPWFTVGTWVVIVLAWILIASRAIPLRNGDRGIFASMAERLAAGDVLYVDVWDNKEPLFYLTLGAGRVISPYMDVAIELLWLLLCGLAVFAILRGQAVSRVLACLVGLGMAPLIITGAMYYAGFSHLPGVALVLGSYALLTRGHPILAGALLPVLAAFKVVMLPLALAAFVVVLLVHRGDSRVLKVLSGAFGSGLVIAGLLAVRGELRGFIDLLISNVGYSQAGISDAYQWPIWKHLEPVLQGPAVSVVAAICLVLGLSWALARNAARELWWVTVAVLAASVAVTALTGLWPHHGQIFYAPACLALALLIASFPALQRHVPSTLVVVIASAVVLSGAPSMRSTADSLLSARGRLLDLGRTSEAAQDLLTVAKPGSSYARLGKNTDDTHAQGLRDLTHPCYQFVQYTYDLERTLDFIPDCLPRVDYVIVDKGLVPEDGQAAWNRFVARSEAVLAADFTCSTHDWGRLCVNKGLSS